MASKSDIEKAWDKAQVISGRIPTCGEGTRMVTRSGRVLTEPTGSTDGKSIARGRFQRGVPIVRETSRLFTGRRTSGREVSIHIDGSKRFDSLKKVTVPVP